MQSIQAGSRTLISHSYSTDGNHQLTRSDYGNGDSVSYGYDSLGRTTSVRYEDGAQVDYTYDKDNRLTKTTAGSVSAGYTYDALGRMTAMDAQNSGKSVVKTTIGYNDPSSTTATGQVRTWKSGSTTYTYAYDARGNITSVSDGQSTTTYAYDSFDQLVRENNQAAGKTWTYAYDDGGNIQSKTEYAYTTGSLGAAVRTVAYGYGDAGWSDLLTSIGGQSLTADEIGNLLSDGTWTYTWQHGRQLAGMSKTGQTIAYGYDSDGKRITKTVDGTAYNYHYLGDLLVELTWGGNKLHFTYDSTGPLSVNYNGTEYFYVRNAQGDVTGLVTTSGTRVVTYTYDAWGNPLSTTGSMAATLGEQNPLRYRGYVYDTETGLYYLQSRYYNPGWGRFINADSLIDNRGVHTQNVFAYCGNNPVKNIDDNGHLFGLPLGTAIGGITGGIIGGICGGITAYMQGKSVWAGVVSGALAGVAIGVICGFAVDTWGLSLTALAFSSTLSAGAAAGGNLLNQRINYRLEKKKNHSKKSTSTVKNKGEQFLTAVNMIVLLSMWICRVLEIRPSPPQRLHHFHFLLDRLSVWQSRFQLSLQHLQRILRASLLQIPL